MASIVSNFLIGLADATRFTTNLGALLKLDSSYK
jgi:hypothetical protein